MSFTAVNGIVRDTSVSTNFFWTGLNALAQAMSYNWVATGKPLGSYTNWSTNPNQPDGDGPCGEYMFRDTPKPSWNDRGCTTWTGPFICEVNYPCKCYADADSASSSSGSSSCC
jgi:hypothetical protein